MHPKFMEYLQRTGHGVLCAFGFQVHLYLAGGYLFSFLNRGNYLLFLFGVKELFFEKHSIDFSNQNLTLGTFSVPASALK